MDGGTERWNLFCSKRETFNQIWNCNFSTPDLEPFFVGRARSRSGFVLPAEPYASFLCDRRIQIREKAKTENSDLEMHRVFILKSRITENNNHTLNVGPFSVSLKSFENFEFIAVSATKPG